MSENLRDLLRRLAEHETAEVHAVAPDTRTEVGRVLADIRTYRARRTAAISAAAVTVLAIGVATATALTPAPREPAVPSPAPTTSTAPTPSPTTSPEPTVPPEPVRVTGWGVVDSLAQPPSPLWSLPAAAVRPDGLVPTEFADVRTGAPDGGFEAVDAGDVLVTQVSGPEGATWLTGLDTATGAVLWVVEEDGTLPRTWTCAGVTSDGLVACLGSSAQDVSEVLLLDPRTGAVVRTLPLSLPASSLGLAGDTVVVHGKPVPTTARWDGVDALTGATLWSHTEPGGASDEAPDDHMFPSTEVQGLTARLVGFGYTAVIDTTTGERTTTGLPDHGAEAAPTVWAPSPGVTVPRLVVVPFDEATGAPRRLDVLDPADGSVRWTRVTNELHGVVGDGVLVGDDTGMTFLDLATGTERWSTGPGTVVATDGERVLVAPRESGPVAALSLADGSTAWSVPAPGGQVYGTSITPRHLAVSGLREVQLYAW